MTVRTFEERRSDRGTLCARWSMDSGGREVASLQIEVVRREDRRWSPLCGLLSLQTKPLVARDEAEIRQKWLLWERRQAVSPLIPRLERARLRDSGWDDLYSPIWDICLSSQIAYRAATNIGFISGCLLVGLRHAGCGGRKLGNLQWATKLLLEVGEFSIVKV